MAEPKFTVNANGDFIDPDKKRWHVWQLMKQESGCLSLQVSEGWIADETVIRSRFRIINLDEILTEAFVAACKETEQAIYPDTINFN